MADRRIHRLTLFKIPNAVDQEKLIDIYRNMSTKALKVRRQALLRCRTMLQPNLQSLVLGKLLLICILPKGQ